MKKSVVCWIASCLSVITAFAYEWTGAVDASWKNEGNWNPSGYPHEASDVALFAKDASVSLDTGGRTEIRAMQSTAGTTTITATDGSSVGLNVVDDDTQCLQVRPGATLVLDTPVTVSSNGRIDRYYEGTLVYRRAFTNLVSGAFGLITCCGTNIVEDSADFYMPNSGLYLGMDSNYGRNHTWPFIVRDRATVHVKNIGYAGGGTVPDMQFVQDGEQTVVQVDGGITFEQKRRDNDDHAYILKAGTLTIGGTVAVDASTVDAEGTVGDPLKPHFIVEGGRATVGALNLSSASAALRGGWLKVGSLSVTPGTAFEFSGGTLETGSSFKPNDWTGIAWSGDVAIAPAGDLTWDWNRTASRPDSLTYDGGGIAVFLGKVSTTGVGFGLAANRLGRVNAFTLVTAPEGSYEPWSVRIGDGATLQLQDITARLALPLDLTIEGSGKVDMCNVRNFIVAHKLTVGGEFKAKGRYQSVNNASWLYNGSGQGQVVVPYVWTGKGDGTSWSNGDNWDTGTVPPGGGDTCVDLSRATSVTLSEDVVVGCVIAMPNERNRHAVAITGDGKMSINCPGFCTAFFVTEGSELTLDVDVDRATANNIAFGGGGRVVFKKSFPGPKNNDATAYLDMDAEVVWDGVTKLSYFGTVTDAYLPIWSHEVSPVGKVVVTGETAIDDLGCLVLSREDNGQLREFRQTGGMLTLGVLDICSRRSADVPTYYLEGGTLNLTHARGLKLGCNYVSSGWKRYPGGSFVMTGGTLNTYGYETKRNQNFIRASGGVINFVDLLGGKDPDNKSAADDPSAYTQFSENEYDCYFGGVTLHPGLDAYNCTALVSKFWLTGENGDLKVDGTQGILYFNTGSVLAGPGGLEVKTSNSYPLFVRANCTFTGAFTLKSGKTTFEAASTLNGPTVLRVESGTLTLAGTIAKSPESICVHAASGLSLNSTDQNLTVKRLVVAGEEKGPGTYSFGNGTVSVVARPDSWISNGAGDLSPFADGAAATLAASAAVDSLVYRSASGAGTVTIAPEEGAVLTFNDGAVIDVQAGSTLVVNADVVLDGKVTKTGFGEIFFNGKVTQPAGVTPGAEGSDAYWLTVNHGSATFDGAVEGVRLVTCSGDGDTPVITLKEHCTVSNYAIVLTAYTDDKSVANCRGETHQEGAAIDYSTVPVLIFSNWGAVPMSRMNGGAGRYVLDSGSLTVPSGTNLNFIAKSDDEGSFEFVQNGGTLTVGGEFYFSRHTKGQSFVYTLNDGELHMGWRFMGYNSDFGTVNFNGGTVTFARSGAVLNDNVFIVNGTPVFRTADADVSVILGTLSGTGVPVFAGPGSFVVDAYPFAALTITGGQVHLREAFAKTVSADLAVTLAAEATLGLDYTGTIEVDTLVYGGKAMAPRTYEAGVRAIGRDSLTGFGKLKVLNGPVTGMLIMVR